MLGVCVGANAVHYECNFLIHGNDGEITVARARAFNARNLPQAIKWVDEKVQSAHEVFHKASVMPKRSMWRVVQFDTLRLCLIKIAARVVEIKTMIRVHLPTSRPGQDILRFTLGRILRLVT
jgi:hypothetical protein